MIQLRLYILFHILIKLIKIVFYLLCLFNVNEKCQILYYIREGYYNHASKVINFAMKTYPNDGILKYYNAITSILQDKNHEAVRYLESLKNRDEDVGLGSMLALLYAHKKFSSVGKKHIELKNKNKFSFFNLFNERLHLFKLK